MPKKECAKCEKAKAVGEFGANRNNKDGLQKKCKQCRQEYNRSDAGKASNRRRVARYARTAKGKASRKRHDARYKAKYPDKRKAVRVTNYAIETGRIPRPDTLVCSCGKQAKEYHHPDYKKPLDVIPLCLKCHQDLH